MVVRLRLARFGRKVSVPWGARDVSESRAALPCLMAHAATLMASADPTNHTRCLPCRRTSLSTEYSQQTRGVLETAGTWSSWVTLTPSQACSNATNPCSLRLKCWHC